MRRFWLLMGANDFELVSEILSPDLVFELPQSEERFIGPRNFVRFNQEYPAHGRWTFEIRRLIASVGQAVTQVAVSDGVQRGEPITFFQLDGGLIGRITEYWPEASPAATERHHLSQPMSPGDH